VNCLAEVTVYVPVPLIEQLLPVEGAVTSTQLPVVEEIVAPPVTDQATPFVTPFVTVAKMRRKLPANTLKPYAGWVMAMEMGPVIAGFWMVSEMATL
jgi:hypothetical protein